MRKHPGSPPEVTPQELAAVITQVREYQLITPLFGGGAVAGETDPITTIRGSEVRGQLRFWWRAYRGGQYKTLEELKQAEDKIWGTASTKHGGGPSQVHIQIEADAVPANAQKAPFFINQAGKVRSRENVAPAYAAFPLQPSDEDIHAGTPLKTVCIGVSFTLTISFPDTQQQDIEAALWAWETFGGIGARTRRGFGALRLVSVNDADNTDLPDANTQTPEDWIKRKLGRIIVPGTYLAGMPHLKPTTQFKITPPSSDAKAVWDDLIDALKSFRQRRRPSAHPNNPGRSEWPEPSEIRKLTNQSLPAHSSPIPNPPIHKFPRAVFGLPIIFQFKDRDRNYHDNPNKDPRQTVLQLETSERLASPLILKPLACKDGKYVGLALLLEGTGVDEDQLILKTQKGTPDQQNVKAAFAPTESLVVGEDNSGAPIHIDSATNALQAFLRYL